MNDVDEVRRMLAPLLDADTGPRHSPEEVLRSARQARARRRSVVAGALSVGVVLAIGVSALSAVTGRSTVEPMASAVLTTTPTDVPPVRTTPEHAAELTARLEAAARPSP